VTENGQTSYTNQLFSITVPNGTGTPKVSSAKGRRYLDITNPAAVEWFYDCIWGELIDMGVDGVKIDFAEELPDAGVDYNGVSIEYDWYDPSLITRGTEHHAYPIFFTSSFHSRMNELKRANGETDGFTVLARGGGIGAQRYPFMWAGDQIRAFWKLDDHLMATVTSGLSGMPFMTYDMAGYRYSTSGTTYTDPNSRAYESEVYVRALQYTAFTPTVQVHGSVRNVYDLSEDAQKISRLYLSLRAELLTTSKNALVRRVNRAFPQYAIPCWNIRMIRAFTESTTSFYWGML
jgi:alpha-glucosidase (family GH31 glycosyl hydrolase)